MNVTTLAGTIERRVLVNYRVDPDVVAHILPDPFRPSLVGGYAIASICMVELRVRPSWMPQAVGFRSFSGAHRFAVTLEDGSDAVYIPRRDTDSRLNALLGGRLFPGVNHPAAVTVQDSGDQISLELASRDDVIRVSVDASIADELPETSAFDSVQHLSDFFEDGCLGYSDALSGDRYEALELRTPDWSITPLAVKHATSSFFDDRSQFPAGAAHLDNAFLMRAIQHSWHPRPSLQHA